MKKFLFVVLLLAGLSCSAVDIVKARYLFRSSGINSNCNNGGALLAKDCRNSRDHT